MRHELEEEVPLSSLIEQLKDRFGYVFDKAFEGLVIARMDRNQDVGVKILNNGELKKFLTKKMREEVYGEVRAEQKESA